MLLKAVFSSNCTNSLWKREDDRWENPQNGGCKTSGSSWKERGIPNCSCKHKVGYTTIGRETLRTNSCWHTLSAICLPGSAGQRTAMSACNHEVHRRRHQKCVLCACQFHLHQGSEKAISFPDSLNTLKKTSVQNDQSRLAHVRYVRKAEKQHVQSKTTGGADGPRPFHQFRVSENDGQDLLLPVCVRLGLQYKIILSS